MEGYRVWKPASAPKGIVQLVHGMAEHIGRYERLAGALNRADCLVIGRNLRGHGPDAEQLGYFADHNGWQRMIDDLHADQKDIQQKYPSIPFFLLGHSMGSFLSRECAVQYGKELDGLILEGTGYFPRNVCRMGWMLAMLSPRRKPARLVDKIAFSGNNKSFRPKRTGFEWLTRDEEEIDRYMADPLCGFCFTGKAFWDFFVGMEALTYEDNLKMMPKELPVLFLSGDHDPVGDMGKGVGKVAEQFKAIGMRDVTVNLYQDARHELFNELNREQVTADLIEWLNNRIK